MASEIVIQMRDKRWNAHCATIRNDIKKAIRATFRYMQQRHEKKPRCASLAISGDIAVVLADDAFITPLNAQYRKKPTATNVLSFEAQEAGMLGDIILAYETIAQEARHQKKSFQHHTMHLIIHGTLHLMGFDHENAVDAKQMESQEIAILAGLGIENPYIKV